MLRGGIPRLDECSGQGYPWIPTVMLQAGAGHLCSGSGHGTLLQRLGWARSVGKALHSGVARIIAREVLS